MGYRCTAFRARQRRAAGRVGRIGRAGTAAARVRSFPGGQRRRVQPTLGRRSRQTATRPRAAGRRGRRVPRCRGGPRCGEFDRCVRAAAGVADHRRRRGIHRPHSPGTQELRRAEVRRERQEHAAARHVRHDRAPRDRDRDARLAAGVHRGGRYRAVRYFRGIRRHHQARKPRQRHDPVDSRRDRGHRRLDLAGPPGGTGGVREQVPHSMGRGRFVVDRRKFLAAGGAVAGVAAAAGFGGQYLQNKRFSVNTASVKLAAPARRAPKLARGTEISNIPGLSAFYTPNSQFYRVDTALVVPQVDPRSWQLRIHGMVDKPMTITFTDLMKRPMIDHDVTLTCVSESVGGGYVGNARWQGALLADLLKEAGVQKGAAQIVMRDVNGMNLGVATDPVMDGRASLLAVGMNGQPLPQEHGFPVRVVVPGLYGYVSACKWVVDMELTTFAAFGAYWTQRGWSQQAPIKTESRIDTPKGNVTAGTVMIAGVAWAQHRGVEAVEVGIDGSWHQAKLTVQDTIDTWRQWYYPWQATAGKHTLRVRATDKTGYTQTPVYQKPEPNGATGYHTVQVTVA